MPIRAKNRKDDRGRKGAAADNPALPFVYFFITIGWLTPFADFAFTP